MRTLLLQADDSSFDWIQPIIKLLSDAFGVKTTAYIVLSFVVIILLSYYSLSRLTKSKQDKAYEDMRAQRDRIADEALKLRKLHYISLGMSEEEVDYLLNPTPHEERVNSKKWWQFWK
ncbi:hypothetical protein [Phaeocystidibacter luteus]|uniref:Uncharacterized protein n=1 Tax=Phaeocystidibacter luteus TaxID=911197 RepID=A0A6N6RLU8_9FLAO|nr:hypothetical protein [Phaeocystidibacter luteus]KAB2814550.1 hypothetical protein F8C67_02085 [Phaeocystidibacter luteus]